jgi:uncharacterized membrane protein YbhN (UPF0104 family)
MHRPARINSSAPSLRALMRGRRGRLAVGAALTLAALAGVVWAVDLVRMRAAVEALAARPGLLAGLLVAYTGAFALRAVAWARLLPGLRAGHALAILLAALLTNHVLPVKGGDVLRPVLAARHGVGLERAAVATVAARAVDLACLVALAGVLMTAAPAGLPAPAAVLLALAALMVGAGGLAWVRGSQPLPLPAPLVPLAERVRAAVRAMGPRQLAVAAAWTAPSWVLEGVVLYAAAQAAGVELSLTAAVGVTAFTILFQTVHLTPGGVGVYEAAMTGALAAHGVPASDALGLALLTHGIKFAYAFTVGLTGAVAEAAPAGSARILRLPLLAAAPALALAAVLGALGHAGFALTALAVAPVAGAGAVLARQWLPAWRPLPPAPLGSGPVVVVIPAFNERDNLPATLAAVPRALVPGLRVVVVDDGSTDGSGAVATAHGADVVVRHPANRGLGAALRTGLAEARAMGARAAVYLDADGEYDPAQVPTLLAALEGGADYVLGSRYAGTRRGQRLSRNVANRLFTAALCVAAGRRISDGQTGYRAFSARALAVAEIIHDYNYAQVLTLDLLRKRMRLAEVPISWRRRERGSSFVRLDYLWRVPVGMTRQLLRP